MGGGYGFGAGDRALVAEDEGAEAADVTDGAERDTARAVRWIRVRPAAIPPIGLKIATRPGDRGSLTGPWRARGTFRLRVASAAVVPRKCPWWYARHAHPSPHPFRSPLRPSARLTLGTTGRVCRGVRRALAQGDGRVVKGCRRGPALPCDVGPRRLLVFCVGPGSRVTRAANPRRSRDVYRPLLAPAQSKRRAPVRVRLSSKRSGWRASTRKLSKSSAASSPRGMARSTGPNHTVPSRCRVGVPT